MVQSQGPKSLTIGRLAAGGNVGVETIRFYQRKGLLEIPTREGGIRRYGSEDLRRLRFIRQAQTAGFTLEEIKELLKLDATEDRNRARELAKDRIKALDDKISELERSRKAHQRLATECGHGSSGPWGHMEAIWVVCEPGENSEDAIARFEAERGPHLAGQPAVIWHPVRTGVPRGKDSICTA